MADSWSSEDGGMPESTTVANTDPGVKSDSLFYAEHTIAGSKMGRALPLIDLDPKKGKLSVSKEGKQLLHRLDKRQHANLVFIFGNARSGKSFMMNCLVGVHSLFKVVNSSEPCTKGVDISSYVCKHASLASHVGVPSSRDAPQLGFVDVEGQGAEDGTYDTMLALPLLMTSKVVMFNHKGAPTVSDMLSKLGVLARAAEYVELGDDEEGSRRKFGHLHVLFRDFNFEGDKASVYDQLLGMEKVQKKLGNAPGGHDPAKAAKERNDIRHLLLNNFQSINVHIFEQPGSAADLRAYKELPEELIDPGFVTKVKELLTLITQQTAEPTMFNGAPLTGPKLEDMLTQVCRALNEGGVINVPSVFKAMEKETVLRVAKELLAKFTQECTDARTTFPAGAEELSELTKKWIQSALNTFDAELEDCSLDEDKKFARKDLETTIAALATKLLADNAELGLARVKEVIVKEFAACRDNFEKYCEKNLPMPDPKVLDLSFKKMKDESMKQIEAKLYNLPGALEEKNARLFLLDQEEMLQQVLNIQTIKNENGMKEQQIEKLRAEAISQQEELIAQNKKLEKYLTGEKSNTADMERKLQQMKDDRANDMQRTEDLEKLLAEQQAELEELRKKKKGCVIL